MNLWGLLERLERDTVWDNILVLSAYHRSLKKWPKEDVRKANPAMFEPYCTIRRLSSLSLNPSPIGAQVRLARSEDVLNNAALGDTSYFADMERDRLVTVLDQGERVVAMVYELFELWMFVTQPWDGLDLAVRQGETELWRVEGFDVRHFDEYRSYLRGYRAGKQNREP
jgi:hypothetical protein